MNMKMVEKNGPGTYYLTPRGVWSIVGGLLGAYITTLTAAFALGLWVNGMEYATEYAVDRTAAYITRVEKLEERTLKLEIGQQEIKTILRERNPRQTAHSNVYMAGRLHGIPPLALQAVIQ